MDQSMERQDKRVRYLKALYDEIDRWHVEHPENTSAVPLVNYPELGERLGFTPAETGQVVEYLKGEHLVKGVAGRSITITHNGIKTVEDRLHTELASRGRASMDDPDTTEEGVEMVKVFISHSSRDERLVKLFVRLLTSALHLRSADIRCTSLEGYGLPGGARTSDQLRQELLEAPVVIGLVSEASFGSAWVLFELGARWLTSKCLIPLLAPGVGADILKGPVVELHALRCDGAGLHKLLRQVSRELDLEREPPEVYQEIIDEISSWTTGPDIRGELTIVNATWGCGDSTKNLTDFLRSKVVDGVLEIWTTVEALGCDPAPMSKKRLMVEYSYGAEKLTKNVPEDHLLSLP